MINRGEAFLIRLHVSDVLRDQRTFTMSLTQPRTSERGQIITFTALLLPILLGMAAMAVDLGGLASDRRQLQNGADSIALAASRDLPNVAAAQASAQAWAAKNNVQWADVTFAVTPAGSGNPNPKVSIDIRRPYNFAFIRVLGIKSSTVGAHAAAIKTSPGGIAGLTPWAVLQSTQQAATPGSLVTLKYDANNPTTGNFGAIRLDGNGASVYQSTVDNGSTSTVCAQGVSGCSSTGPVCTTDVCPSQTGNVTGPTRSGIDFLMANTAIQCNSFGLVFSGPTNGKYTLNPQCNPWLSGSYASKRVIILPVISSLCNGSCALTVVSFAMFWLEGYQSGQCTGNSCQVQGRFVNADLTVDALAGVFDPNSSIHFTRLSE
jgi:Putative Flp pilus-assembly TadE/G-like